MPSFFIINAEPIAGFNAVFIRGFNAVFRRGFTAVQQSSLQLTTEPQLDLLCWWCCVIAQHKYNALYCTTQI